MPSPSKAAHNLMEARAHGATFPMAEKIPLKVAKEFVEADKGKDLKRLPQHVTDKRKANNK